MEAYDALRPRNKAYAEVFIQVLRNQGAPTWDFLVPNVNMREDKPSNDLVIQVNATDKQDNVRRKVFFLIIKFLFSETYIFLFLLIC